MNTDFILSIEHISERKGNPFMLVYERISNEQLRVFELEQIAPNKQYVVCHSNEDISIGSEFDVIFPYSNPNEYVVAKSTLSWVSIKKTIKSDTLLAGYTAIGILEFPAAPPPILLRVKYYDEPSVPGKHDSLYFTNQILMDKILTELKK